MADKITMTVDAHQGSQEEVVIKLRNDLAPKHCEQITKLAKDGFYDGLTFHRVIDGFMAQGGCPDGTGMGGAKDNIPAEFSKEPHVRGICSMARSQNPNSASSQFFVVLMTPPSLITSTRFGAKSRAAWSILMRCQKVSRRACLAKS